MNGHFLILGYPRSRTAWLANLLTYGDVFCAHELLSECRQPSDWFMQLPTEFAFSGSAETAGAFVADKLMVPGLRVAIIWRSHTEVAKSLAEHCATDGMDVCEKMLPFMHRASRLPNAMNFHYESLSTFDGCRALLEHVAPGTTLSQKRYEMLADFNVQITDFRWDELRKLGEENGKSLVST